MKAASVQDYRQLLSRLKSIHAFIKIISLCMAMLFLTAWSSNVQQIEQAAVVNADHYYPNIVFIVADQMRAHAMGAMGNQQVITPNLDKLADEGLLISNAISGHPVCTPFRTQLMTGRYSHSTGIIYNDIRVPDEAVLFPQLLKQHGYTNAKKARKRLQALVSWLERNGTDIREPPDEPRIRQWLKSLCKNPLKKAHPTTEPRGQPHGFSGGAEIGKDRTLRAAQAAT